MWFCAKIDDVSISDMEAGHMQGIWPHIYEGIAYVSFPSLLLSEYTQQALHGVFLMKFNKSVKMWTRESAGMSYGAMT